jgi:hypothetical protein
MTQLRHYASDALGDLARVCCHLTLGREDRGARRNARRGCGQAARLSASCARPAAACGRATSIPGVQAAGADGVRPDRGRGSAEIGRRGDRDSPSGQALEIGEASVVIVAGAAHRAGRSGRAATDRARQTKTRCGSRSSSRTHAWVRSAVADPNDDLARQEARRRACVTVRLFAQLRDAGLGARKPGCQPGASATFSARATRHPAIAPFGRAMPSTRRSRG